MNFKRLTILLMLTAGGLLCRAEEADPVKPGDHVSSVYKEHGSPTIEFPLNGKWIQDYGEFIVVSTNRIIISVNYKGEAIFVETNKKAPTLTQAEFLLAKATEGDASAQCRLAYCFQTGTDFPEDKEECIKWYTAAAVQDNVVAQHNLGIIHMKGEGVKKDFVAAYAWAVLAEKNGNETLLKALGPVLQPDQKLQGELMAKQLAAGFDSSGEQVAEGNE